jgi:SET domain-containing protein
MTDVRPELADTVAAACRDPRPEDVPFVPRIDSAATAFRLEAKPSPIHRFGIFAAQAIPANVRVIEYTGERIGYREAERRRERPYLYLFWVAPGRLIDGAVGGSGAEFINHSCAPNLAVDIAEGHVFFVSLREIATGEELLLDYRVRADNSDAPPMPCRCGAASCRGFLNAP